MVRAQAVFSQKWLGEAPIAGQGERLRRLPFLGQGGPINVTDATFSQVLAAPKAVVDFWSPSCPACMAYKPVYEEVAASTPGILMAMGKDVDIPVTAGNYNISGIPTTIFFMNGKEVGRIEGSVSKQQLQSEMARVFGGSVQAGAPAGISGTALLIGGLALAAAGIGAVYLLTKK